MRSLHLLALLPVSLAQQPDTGANETLAIRHVSVLPMDAERVLEDQTVLIQGGRVRAVLPADEAQVPPGARLIEGRGKFLMPGLCDMHAHLSDARDGLLYVANGVTTIRNLSGQAYHLDLAREYARGTYVGPTLVSSGPQVRLDAGAGPAAAEAAVAQAKAAGFASVKLYGRTSLKNYQAMATAARRHGIPIVGHVPRNLTLEDTLAIGGHREISHAEEMLYSFFDRHEEPQDELLDECAALIAEAGTYVTATISVYAEIEPQILNLAEVLARPEMRYLPPLGHAIFGPGLNKYTAFDKGEVERHRRRTETILALTGAMHEAGVPILLGTDAMNPSVLPGFSIHDELERLVEAGLSPYDAFVAGTTRAAAFWSLEDSVGRVAPGQRADLVLLEANPFEDVAHFRRLDGVVLRGRWFGRDELEARLEEQIAGYATEAVALEKLDPEDPTAMLDALSAAEVQPPEAFFLSVISVLRLINDPAAAEMVCDYALEHFPDSSLLANRKAEAELEKGPRGR